MRENEMTLDFFFFSCVIAWQAVNFTNRVSESPQTTKLTAMEAEESDRNGATSPQRTAERAGQGAACQ